MNVGEKIAGLRKKNNMTQAELGDVLSVTYQAVSKWERGESLPDFETISRISKIFQVPISYFEDGVDSVYEPVQEVVQNVAPPLPPQPQPIIGVDVIGMCVQCGRVVRDGEAGAVTPQIICWSCAENNRQAMEARYIAEQQARAAAVQRKKDKIENQKKDMKRTRNRALIFSTIPAGVIFIFFLVISLTVGRSVFPFIFGAGVLFTVTVYTFAAQMVWGGVVREICTGGGFIMNLPGIIFAPALDSILLGVFLGLFLGLISVVVFVGSFVVCFLVAVAISPFTFVPSLLLYNRKIRKVGTEGERIEKKRRRAKVNAILKERLKEKREARKAKTKKSR